MPTKSDLPNDIVNKYPVKHCQKALNKNEVNFNAQAYFIAGSVC